MATFLRSSFSWWELIHPHKTNFEEDLKTVAGFIDGQYGTNLLAAQQGAEHFSPEVAMALSKINVEELLALADENRTLDIRRALERVIFKTIEREIRLSHKYYYLLVRKILESGQKACLISFNYDLLLDRAVTDATRHENGTWSYAVPFHAGVEQFPSYSGSADPTILLLKLHGSLNWGQCQKCDSLRLWAYNSYDNIFRTKWPECENCSGASTGFKPVLVAPTPAKLIPSALNDAWTTAADFLQQTKKLTVIGYSFPAVDRECRRLVLRNLIIRNMFAHSRPKLVLVDKDATIRMVIKLWFQPAVDNNVEEHCSFEAYCSTLQ
jgi:hypothetical protein